jgi:dihydrofolate reductase
MDEKGGIGKDNHLPWYLSSDLQRFKSLTMGHTRHGEENL